MINFIKRLFCRHYKVEQGEPVAYRFTQNRGNGKTDFTYHDHSEKNNWRTAYRDNCLEITPLYLHPVRPLTDAQIEAAFEKVASLHAIPVNGSSVVFSTLVGIDQAKEFARAIEEIIKGATEPQMTKPKTYSRCSNTLRLLGKPYPRTCQECGLGPCKDPIKGATE